MELGEEDGHGRYGMLDETSDGLVCHECGRAFPNLGLHAWRGHGMTAAQYARPTAFNDAAASLPANCGSRSRPTRKPG